MRPGGTVAPVIIASPLSRVVLKPSGRNAQKNFEQTEQE